MTRKGRHSHTDTHRHTQTHTDTQTHTRVCVAFVSAAWHLGTATTCCLMMMMTMMRVVYLGRTLTQFLQTTSASFHSFALHLPPPSTCSDGQAVSMGDASVCRINPRTHSCPRRHWQMVAFFWNECETVCTLSRSKHGHKGKADR